MDSISNHVGQVGERRLFDLRITKVLTFQSQFGPVYLHLMVDSRGNIFTWKASVVCLDANSEVRLKGTIKANNLYNGIRQTELTRCKVEG